MNRTLTAPRALTALMARRVLNIATVTALIITACGVVISAILVYFFTPWWWLLAVPFVLALGIFLLIRLICMAIIGIIHPNTISKQQELAMSEFVDKIQRILEARSTPLFLIALICIKDILFHRDIVTIKKIIADTTSLRKEYIDIEKLFREP